MTERDLVLVVVEGCPYCEVIKKALLKDSIRVLDVTKDLKEAGF